jgi:hypothetical protein
MLKYYQWEHICSNKIAVLQIQGMLGIFVQLNFSWCRIPLALLSINPNVQKCAPFL